MIPMSHSPNSLISVRGLRSNSTRSAKSNSRSSRSSSDIWQPKQPHSEQVAIFSLASIMAAPSFAFRQHRHIAHHVDRFTVVEPLADGDFVSPVLEQNRSGRTDLSGLVGDAEIGRTQLAGSVAPSLPDGVLTTRCALMPRPCTAKIFLPSTSRLARTHSSQRMQRLKSITASGWEASTGRRG